MLGFQGTNIRNQYVATSDGQRFLINQPPQGTNSSPLLRRRELDRRVEEEAPVIRTAVHAFVLVLVLACSAGAQPPTGTIAGTVTDATPAAIVGAQITITHLDTDQIRRVDTSAEGQFAAELLPPGSYRLTVAVAGFKRLERNATVNAGTTTTIDLVLEVGDVSETLTVRAAVPLLQNEQHQVAGVVQREQIEQLPLNGRNFLELAKLEPGMTNPARLGDNRTFVSFEGSGLQTVPRVGYSRVTIDGASIVTPGTAGVLFQVSQDVVQEFQISTVNFDPATSLSSNGAINIVTRSGGNDFRGSTFAYYRDHHLSAYPALRRDPLNPDPFFQRAQFGVELGSPIRTDRAFLFGHYERHDQDGVMSVQPRSPEFAPLGGIFPSPYSGDQFSVRSDVRLTANHNAFVRYTHDDNRLFGPATVLPSAWFRRTNRSAPGHGRAHERVVAARDERPRFSHFFFETQQRPATADDCAGCLVWERRPSASRTWGSAR